MKEKGTQSEMLESQQLLRDLGLKAIPEKKYNNDLNSIYVQNPQNYRDISTENLTEHLQGVIDKYKGSTDQDVKRLVDALEYSIALTKGVAYFKDEGPSQGIRQYLGIKPAAWDDFLNHPDPTFFNHTDNFYNLPNRHHFETILERCAEPGADRPDVAIITKINESIRSWLDITKQQSASTTTYKDTLRREKGEHQGKADERDVALDKMTKLGSSPK